MKLQKNIRIDKFVCLRSKMYAFICGDDYKNKLKGVSKSYFKNIRFEEYKKCLDDKKYQQECDNYITRWLNHEMYLQRVKRSTLFIFGDKGCYENNIKSKPWH